MEDVVKDNLNEYYAKLKRAQELEASDPQAASNLQVDAGNHYSYARVVHRNSYPGRYTASEHDPAQEGEVLGTDHFRQLVGAARSGSGYTE